MIDATYDYGFARLKGKLPPNTFGGFPGDYYSTGYNAGYGTAGLASQHHRDQGILSYEFMIANSQSGPYSWWESSSAPSTDNPWLGRHPASGQGSSPHAWGMSQANGVLLASLVAQRTDGAIIVGRGVPAQWLRGGRADLGYELPDDRWPEAEPQDLIEWPVGIAHAARQGTVRPGALPAAAVHRQHRHHLGRSGRPTDRDRDIVTGHEERHRPTPRSAPGLRT